MSDASGENLDWFWRGWFYGTDPVDISLDSVKFAKADFNNMPTGGGFAGRRGGIPAAPAANPLAAPTNPLLPAVNAFDDISKVRNRQDKNIKFQTDVDTATHDFYWKYDRGLVTIDTAKIRAIMAQNPPARAAAPEPFTDTEKANYSNKYFYELSFSNKGGLVMPIIVQFTYKDGTTSIDKIPAQIWRLNEKNVSKFYIQDKEVASIKIDPMHETADIDESNNYWGKAPEPSKFLLFKQRTGGGAPARGQSTGVNPMQIGSSK
jgi:hypothetical protein